MDSTRGCDYLPHGGASGCPAARLCDQCVGRPDRGHRHRRAPDRDGPDLRSARRARLPHQDCRSRGTRRRAGTGGRGPDQPRPTSRQPGRRRPSVRTGRTTGSHSSWCCQPVGTARGGVAALGVLPGVWLRIPCRAGCSGRPRPGRRATRRERSRELRSNGLRAIRARPAHRVSQRRQRLDGCGQRRCRSRGPDRHRGALRGGGKRGRQGTRTTADADLGARGRCC